MKTKITNIGSIVSYSTQKGEVQSLSNHEILIDDEQIIEIAPTVGEAEIEINADGALLTPGFVDSHTHPVFFCNRANEFGMRVAGKSYEEIAKSGGGIISSINAVRGASEDQLFDECIERVNFFLGHGTTTIEAKSGYGLTVEDELKSLRVIRRMNEASQLDVLPTLLGAHDFPPEFKNKRDGYVDVICNEMIPQVAEEKLAVFCDVFCEIGYFTVEQSRRILETAKENGLIPRLHADEFVDSGAAYLASEVGAISADHLMAVSDDGINALSQKGVIATLLPGTTFFLGKNTYAQGRKMVDAGCDIALATDFNPGSCTLQSMPMVMFLATQFCGLSVKEAFTATTFNSAKSLQLETKIGAIEIGFQADVLFWEINSIDEIPYWLHSTRILNVMKKGELLGD